MQSFIHGFVIQTCTSKYLPTGRPFYIGNLNSNINLSYPCEDDRLELGKTSIRMQNLPEISLSVRFFRSHLSA